MLPPAETVPHAIREAIRPATLTAIALALCAASPAAAQRAADNVGNVIDPQGEPGDPQPDRPTLDEGAGAAQTFARGAIAAACHAKRVETRLSASAGAA